MQTAWEYTMDEVTLKLTAPEVQYTLQSIAMAQQALSRKIVDQANAQVDPPEAPPADPPDPPPKRPGNGKYANPGVKDQ